MSKYLSDDTVAEEVPQYYYYAAERVLQNEFGDIIEFPTHVFNPNVLWLLRHNKDHMFAYTNRGELVEIIYEDSYVYIYGDYNQPIDRR